MSEASPAVGTVVGVIEVYCAAVGASTGWLDRPMSTYEVHLGSWARVPEEGHRFLTYRELADWLSRFGAYNGLELDGGGSTTMVRSDDHGGVIVLNRPINQGIPGNQRWNACHLGVFAAPLPPRR